MAKSIHRAIGKIFRLMPVRMAEQYMLALESRVGVGAGSGASKSGERVVFEVLKRTVEGPLMVFDVGANQGQYASEALAQLGEGRDYQIHCFEPSPKTFGMLRAKHGENGRIKLNNFGLAKEEGKSTLFMDSEGSGAASLTERRLEHLGIEHGKIREEVELTTLDRYAAESGVERINLLKVDVEGHELDVLSGGKGMLDGKKIDLVQFEFGGCNIDTRSFFQDFHYFFSEHDYDLFRILPSGKLLSLPIYREMDEKFRTANYLAARKSLDITGRCGGLFV